MSTPITITVPHQLGRDEARRRIQSGFSSIAAHLPVRNCAYSEQWEGDRLNFRVTAMGQVIGGTVDVGASAVTIEIELPAMLAAIASRIQGSMKRVARLLLAKE